MKNKTFPKQFFSQFVYVSYHTFLRKHDTGLSYDSPSGQMPASALTDNRKIWENP